MVNSNFLYMLTITSIITLTCCQRRETAYTENFENINIKVNSNDKTNLGIKIEKIIQLETREDCLLGHTSKLEYFNNHLYIMNAIKARMLYAFNEDGVFINKTKKGKGPGEFVNPYAFAINKMNGTIILYDYSTKPLIVLDQDLNEIRRIQREYSIMKDFCHIRNDTFLFYDHKSIPNSKGPEFDNYFIITNNFKKIESLGIHTIGDKVSTRMYCPFWINEEEVLIKPPWGYDIMRLENDMTLKTRYSFDFGKYGLSETEINNSSEIELDHQMAEGLKIIQIYGFQKTKEFIAITTTYKRKIKNYFYSFSSKKSYDLDLSIEAGLIPQNITIWGTTESGMFYGLVEPGDLIDFTHKSHVKLQNKPRFEDNPSVIFFSIYEN